MKTKFLLLLFLTIIYSCNLDDNQTGIDLMERKNRGGIFGPVIIYPDSEGIMVMDSSISMGKSQWIFLGKILGREARITITFVSNFYEYLIDTNIVEIYLAFFQDSTEATKFANFEIPVEILTCQNYWKEDSVTWYNNGYNSTWVGANPENSVGIDTSKPSTDTVAGIFSLNIDSLKNIIKSKDDDSLSLVLKTLTTEGILRFLSRESLKKPYLGIVKKVNNKNDTIKFYPHKDATIMNYSGNLPADFLWISRGFGFYPKWSFSKIRDKNIIPERASIVRADLEIEVIDFFSWDTLFEINSYSDDDSTYSYPMGKTTKVLEKDSIISIDIAKLADFWIDPSKDSLAPIVTICPNYPQVNIDFISVKPINYEKNLPKLTVYYSLPPGYWYEE